MVWSLQNRALQSRVSQVILTSQAHVQILGGAADERADIFSYGILLYKICTSEVPERGHLRSVRCEQSMRLQGVVPSPDL